MLTFGFIGCHGRGSVVCPTCNADQDPGFYNEGQMSQCPACYGRGLIAHKDGSDSMLAPFFYHWFQILSLFVSLPPSLLRSYTSSSSISVVSDSSQSRISL